MGPFLLCTFSIIAIIGIIFLIIGLVDGDEGQLFVGFIITLLVGAVGFGLICGLTPCGTTSQVNLVPDEITRTPTCTVVVSPDNKEVIVSKEHAVYVSKDDDIKISKTVDNNAYGYEIQVKRAIVVIPPLVLERNK